LYIAKRIFVHPSEVMRTYAEVQT